MGLTLITPPATTPITLAQAKSQCRVDSSDEDAEILSCIAAMTDYVEQYTGKALVTQTWRLTLDAFTNSILLPKNPVQSVVSVTYYDTEGVLQTLSPDAYTVDTSSDPAWLVKNADASWPDTADGINMVRIDFVAGYTTIPESINWALRLLIGQQYDNRSSATEKAMMEPPHSVTCLLTNYRNF